MIGELTIWIRRAAVKLLDQQLLGEMLHKVFTQAADDEEGVVRLPDEDVAVGQNNGTDGPQSDTEVGRGRKIPDTCACNTM